MPDPTRLRADAVRLRSLADRLRTGADGLTADLGTLRTRYPLGTGNLWVGPYADRYAQGLDQERSVLDALAGDVRRYADACDRYAGSLDQQADRLELAAVTR